MIRVLIVDDHAVVRQGLRFMLERQPDVSVVGECGDGEKAVALAVDLIPEVILLDLLMPRMDGITAIREIKLLTPATQIIILTSYHDDDLIFSAIKAGALSYLLKDTGPQELIAAVRAAAQDRENGLAPRPCPRRGRRGVGRAPSRRWRSFQRDRRPEGSRLCARCSAPSS